MSWVYYVGRIMVRVLLVLLTHWQVRGRDNIPDRGSLLVIANHLHLVDPPVLAVSLKRKAIFMAKEELFRSRFSGYFIGGFGAFPVSRGQQNRKAIQQAERVLTEGLALIMFPEAARSPNAQMQNAYRGAALVALRNGVPILPVGITGTEKIKGFTWLLRHRPRITVNIGQPFHLPPDNGQVSRSEMAELTYFMMAKVAELVPAEYRGIYQEKRGLNGTES